MLELAPDTETRAWVEGAIGPAEVVHTFSHDHGYSNLWRLRAKGGHFWLKMHARPDKWCGEVHALTRWTPALGLTPSVVAAKDNPPTLLMDEMPGQDAESIPFEGPQEERLWREAGAWLRKLHAIENDWLGIPKLDGSPWGERITDPKQFVGAAFEMRLKQAEPLNLFTQADVDFIVGRVRDQLPSLDGEQPVAIHRDFTPRNWRADAAGALKGVFDFEHSRWEIRAADLNRPPDYEYLRNPRLKDAFFDGYGGSDLQLAAQIELLRLQQAVAGIVWGLLVGEIAYSHRCREALERIMKECS